MEDPKTVTHHKLIHATSEKVLTDSKTVLEEKENKVNQVKLGEVGVLEKKTLEF